MSDPSQAIRRTVHYRGRVQGVGFRYTTLEVARRYPVRGFVENLPDGRVHLVVEGSARDVSEFFDAVKQDLGRYIEDVEIQNESGTGEFHSFEIRH